MKQQRMQMLELLRFNKGFEEPEEWVDYGIEHHFKKVYADKLEECPDCTARSSRPVGQFIYYSTLVKLRFCNDCGLIFVDTRIDSAVIQSHFENAYKDEDYFLKKRSRVFGQLSGLISKAAPQGGRVLDIGGAKGHLLAVLQQERPDLKLVLNDLSTEACNHAAACYGFETMPGDVHILERAIERFDVVVMSDVMYYEPEIQRLWSVVPQLVKPGGRLIIRIPNKLPLIRLWQFFLRKGSTARQERVRFFNPEHLYVFSRSYIEKRLRRTGFEQVRMLPSELLTGDHNHTVSSLCYGAASALSQISLGRLVLTPSCIVVANRCSAGGVCQGKETL